MHPRSKTKNHKGGAPLSARESMYCDEKFNQAAELLDSVLCTPAILREAKLCFKFYSVVHVKRYLRRRHYPLTFKKKTEICDFAERQGIPRHFVECWLDAFSNDQPPLYVPKNNYPEHDLSKRANRHKVQKQIAIDMEYVAKKYFGKFPKALEGDIARQYNLELDVLPATKFIVKLLQFMFFNEIPAQISEQLYKRLYNMDNQFAKYYSYEPENGVAIRRRKRKDYGAMVVLGEDLAVEIFTHPCEYSFRAESKEEVK